MDKQPVNDYVPVLIDVAYEAREPGTDLGELVGRTVQTSQEMHEAESPLDPAALNSEVANYVHCVETTGTFGAGNLDKRLARQLTRSRLYRFMTNRFVAPTVVFAGLSTATFAAFEASHFASHTPSLPNSILDWPQFISDYRCHLWTFSFFEQGFSYYNWRSVVPPMLFPAFASVLIAYFSTEIKNLFDWKERALKKRVETDINYYATALAGRIVAGSLSSHEISEDRREWVRQRKEKEIKKGREYD